jgi:hypothetical protein
MITMTTMTERKKRITGYISADSVLRRTLPMIFT